MNSRDPHTSDPWTPIISPEDAERIERENRQMIEDAFPSDLEPLNFDPPWVRTPAVFPQTIAPEPEAPADPTPDPATAPEPNPPASAAPAGNAREPAAPAPKRRTRAEAARENGRKSRGPKTPEGKAVSSRNAIKHGLSARDVVLGIEREQEWYEFREEARQLLKPVGLIQLGYADEWAAARWRLRRCAGIETLLFDRVLDQQLNEPKVYQVLDNVARIGLAFQTAKEDLNALGGYESRIRRSGERALRTLRELQAEARQHSDPAPAARPAPGPDPSDPSEVPDAREPAVPTQTAEVQNEPNDTQPAPTDPAPPAQPVAPEPVRRRAPHPRNSCRTQPNGAASWKSQSPPSALQRLRAWTMRPKGGDVLGLGLS